MRISSHATQQYRDNSLVERQSQRERKQTEPQVKVKTTSFGFSLGKFGVDYESSSTILDPSLSRDVREERRQAQAFKAESQVEELRATVGETGATYREEAFTATGSGSISSDGSPPQHRLRAAMVAYAKGSDPEFAQPGIMLASVI